MRILLLAGGWSTERDVSLNGAVSIQEALSRLGHTVRLFDPASSLAGLVEAACEQDFVFINLHGSPGEDGLVQALLDQAGCPYQGSGPAGSFLALDKAAAKELFRLHGLNTPNWLFTATLPEPAWDPGLGWPVFVKPNTGGSSLGMGKAENPKQLHQFLENMIRSGNTALIEPLLSGKELTCGILGDRALPPVLIEPATGHDFFDYTAKYTKGACIETCPAPIPEEVTRELQRMTCAAHQLLGLSGYSRADYILTDSGQIYLLEVNTLPGMTPNSLIPQEAAAIGLDFDAFIARLIELGLQRHAERKMAR